MGSGFALTTLGGASTGMIDDNGLFTSSAAGVEGPECFPAGNRGLPIAGERFDGKVLLRETPEVVGVANMGVIGLGTAPECRERFEDVETFLRTPPCKRRLSAPALEVVEAERPIPEPLRPRVVGVRACGVDGPLSMCLTVPSSTAVPSIPIRK